MRGADGMFCGVDEAGRGSVMGPMVVGAVYAEDESALRELGVRDSKKLTAKARERIFDRIVETVPYWTVVTVSAADIDVRRKTASLNDIEMDMFIDACTHRECTSVYVDCPDVNEASFGRRMSERLDDDVGLIAKHKADDTYAVVSAASIVAKVTRDRMLDEIRGQFEEDIGSGYPSDRRTMEFIRGWIEENGRAPEHVRCSWEPVRQMLSRRANTKISDW